MTRVSQALGNGPEAPGAVGAHPVGEGGVDLSEHRQRPGGTAVDGTCNEREDGLLRLFRGEHKGEQEARGMLAPVPLILGIMTDGKSEWSEVVLGARRGGGIEPVDRGGSAEDVDGPEGRAPAGGPRVDVALEVVDDRASVPCEELRGGPQPFAEPGGGDQERMAPLAGRVDAVDGRRGRPTLLCLPPRTCANTRRWLGPRPAFIIA